LPGGGSRQCCRQAPIIVMTANVLAEDTAQSFAAGTNGFLIKLFSPGEL